MCSDPENHKQQSESSKCAVGPRMKASGARGTDVAEPTTVPLRAVDVKTKSTEDEETYRVLNGSFYFIKSLSYE